MKSYVIGYDLDSPGQDYRELFAAIKGIGDYWHCLDSTWIVKTDKSAVEICDMLISHIDSNDKLLVANLSGEAAWTGLNSKCSDWLKNNL